MQKKRLKAAIVGANGLVGKELVDALQRHAFPLESLAFYASWNTAGETVEWKGEEARVEPVSADSFKGVDLVFFTAHRMVSRDLAGQAAGEGCLVIDASRQFRSDPDVPLVVAEVNPDTLANVRPGKGMVAIPSAQTTAVALVAAPLHARFRLEHVTATVVHGSTTLGRKGFEEHQCQTIDILNDQEMKIERFPRQSAFNIFPCVGQFEGEYTEAERELMEELPRLLGADIATAVTAVQAPVFCGLAVSARFELVEEAGAAEVQEALESAPGVIVVDDPENGSYPDTIEAMAHEEVLVGRIRPDPESPRVIHLWIQSDNLRKGSAVNMLRIAELLTEPAG